MPSIHLIGGFAELLSRVDATVLPLLFLGLFVFQLDRMNLASALTAGFATDIGINQATVNLGNQLMFAGIVVLEIPSNMLLQRVSNALPSLQPKSNFSTLDWPSNLHTSASTSIWTHSNTPIGGKKPHWFSCCQILPGTSGSWVYSRWYIHVIDLVHQKGAG